MAVSIFVVQQVVFSEAVGTFLKRSTTLSVISLHCTDVWLDEITIALPWLYTVCPQVPCLGTKEHAQVRGCMESSHELPQVCGFHFLIILITT